MTGRSHNYTLQRNYSYDSHDNSQKFNGLTKEEWKKKILDEWSCTKLNANHVVLIFHDKDKDENGIITELHVHACVNFSDSLTHSQAYKRSKCSDPKNCKQIEKKARAYRYLLHITEKAIKDKKHIYSEDELIIEIAPEEKFDYHKEILNTDDEEDSKEQAKKLKQVISLIQQGAYGNGEFIVGGQSIYDKLLLDNDINKLISSKPANRRAIENAIEVKKETWIAQQRAPKES